MPAKEQQRVIYRTAKGREIDMGKLVQMNELVPAVGNAKVNARGDKLGPGGKIIQRREEIAGSGIPNQINRSRPASVKSPVVTEETGFKGPVASVASEKTIDDQDPEGNENE